MREADAHAAHRYAKHIEAMLDSPGHAPAWADDASTVRVERGMVLPMALADADDPSIQAAADRLWTGDTESAAVVDASGHARPAYPGLLVYACSRAKGVLAERNRGPLTAGWDDGLTRWTRRLSDSARHAHAALNSGRLSASDALTARVELAWTSLGSSHDQLTPWAQQTFADIAREELPNGALLPAVATQSPEWHWYNELVLLHAVADYAELTPNSAMADLVARNAAYHLQETQPDHATSEPWGLLAFIRNSNTHLLADQLLHTVRVQHPRGPAGLTRILLADTLFWLKHARPA